MKWLLMLLLTSSLLTLCSKEAHLQDNPFSPTGTKADQDMGAINKNFQESIGRLRNNRTTTVTPASCPAGQSLTGAVYSNGTTYGGTCASGGMSATGTNSVSGSITFVAGSTLAVNTSFTTSGATMTITNHPVVTGIPYIWASTSPVNSSGLVFAGLDADAEWEIRVSSWAHKTTPGYIQVRFGNAAGAPDITANHHGWITQLVYPSASAYNSSLTDTKCIFGYGDGLNGTIGAGFNATAKLRFNTYTGIYMHGHYEEDHYSPQNTRYESHSGQCLYLPTGAAIGSIYVFPSAGVFSGTITLWRM